MRRGRQFLAIALIISMLLPAEAVGLYAAEEKIVIQSGMVSELPAMVYTGVAVEPEPMVSYLDTVLEKDTDYTVSYENNIKTGTGTAIITGIGQYEGTVTKTFRIQTKKLEKSFVGGIGPQDYTGEKIEPEIELTYNGITLQKNVDYRISYSNNTEVGEATATIKGRGNFVGTIQVNYDIVRVDLNKLETNGTLKAIVGESQEAYETLYTGESIEPEVTVALVDGRKLFEGKDYTVTYENNILPGTATIKILGIGNYIGTIEKTFEIGSQDIANATVTAGNTMTVIYTPTGQKPVPKVAYEGSRLTEGQDFDVVYYLLDEAGARTGDARQSVTDVGTYEVVLKGKGIFAGEFNNAATITVIARSLVGGTVKVQNSYARYDGETVSANYTVLYQNHLLTKEEDYVVAAIEISADEKYATFVFEGKGNYTGILTQQFMLVAEDVVMFSEGKYYIGDIADQSYTGARICPPVSVMSEDGSSVLLENEDYTVSYKYNLNVGTATVTVTGMGNCVGTMQKTFQIVPVDIGMITEIENASVTVGSFCVEMSAREYTYGAVTWKPEVFIKENGAILDAGMDYTVSYRDKAGNETISKDAGTYHAVITLQGNYTGTITFEYTILPMPVTALQMRVPDYAYAGTEIVPLFEDLIISIAGRELSDIEKADLQIISAENNKEVSQEAVMTVKGTGNFTGETQCAFHIVARSLNDSALKIMVGGKEITSSDTGYQVEWTGNAQTPSVEIWNGEEKLVQNEDYTLIYRYNTEIGTARVILSGKNNYQGNRILFFEIVGIILSEEMGYEVSVEETDFYYTGKGIQPEVTVTKGGAVLTKGVDYNVSYSNHINAGTGKVIVTGTGYYAGSIAKEFTILPKTIQQTTTVKVLDIAKQRYTRAVIVPEISIQIDGQKLVQGKDYTVTASNAIEVGTATVVVTGMGNYAGKLAESRFEIYKTTITYVLNGGVNSDENPAYYTASDSITLSAPTREDYIFVGWYSDSACTKRVYGIDAGTDGNKIFYAKWETTDIYGIDVSKWQNQANSSGAINWHSVRQDGKRFAMIRLSYGTTLDPYFDYNYSGARSAGVKVGAYCYNTATTVEGAVAQANDVLAKLGGRPLDYPVCLDMEGDTVGALTDSLRTDIVFAFKNVVEAAGYDFILYANKNWLDNYFDNARLAPLDLWIARYCDFNLGHRYTGNGNVRIWQYSDSGTVNGITGPVDLDICYQDYVKSE